MAEQHIFGFSSFWLYLLYLGVICFSTHCHSESLIAYDVAIPLDSPALSYLVTELVSHSRIRRAVADVAQQDNVTTTAIPSQPTDVAGGGVLPDTPNPSGNTSHEPASVNDTSNTSTNDTHQESPESTSPTSDPLNDPDIIHDWKDYYVVKSNIKNFDDYWVDLSVAPKHEKLSKNHRIAAVIPLKFKFPFYGHPVDNVTIATGGFIYMSPFLHRWLTATQYIAPLMANFDLSIGTDSDIFYLSLEDSFFVEWRNVMLQDQNSSGAFSFQAILKASGEITFVYKSIPVALSDISAVKHPVKAGVSDAYYIDTFIPVLKIQRRTIYEYHKVSVKESDVRTRSVVILHPLPTCNTLNDCDLCTKHENVKFDCHWCNTIGRCSDGLDWYRQHWDRHGCQRTKTDNQTWCELFTTESTETPTTSITPASESTIITTQIPTSATTKTPTTPSTTTEVTTKLTTPGTTTSTARTTTTTVGTTTTTVGTTTTTSKKPTTTLTTTTTTREPTHTSTTTTIKITTTPKTTSTKKSTYSTSTKKSTYSTTTKESTYSTTTPTPTTEVDGRNIEFCGNGKCGKGASTPVAVIVIVILLVSGLAAGIGGWVYYAYTHPTSKSGMWMMEHRPSQIKAKIQFWKSSSDSGAAKYKMESEA